MAKVFIPAAERLARLGYETIAHVPVVFDSSWRYFQDLNRYLRERALLEWHPTKQTNPTMGRLVYPVMRTLVNLANCLKNFVEWLEKRGKDWQTLSYEEVLCYQHEMQTGKWSRLGRPLQPETANARTDAATDFLSWAADRDVRQPFSPPRTRSARFIGSGNASISRRMMAQARAGRARESHTKAIRRLTTIPSAVEIRNWLNTVRTRRGYAKYLTARFILETGVRKEEAAAVTVGQLVSRAELEDLVRRGQFMAPMNLLKTKGMKPRSIQIPLEFASELREWADTKRLTLSYRYHRRTGTPGPTRLFLSDSIGYEGIPLSGLTIYDLFAEVDQPVPHWSPHKARHTFACFYVLHALESEARIHGQALSEMSSDWISQRGSWWISTLRKQLGHASEETTDLYLRWLLTTAKVAEAAAGWHRFLAGDE